MSIQQATSRENEDVCVSVSVNRAVTRNRKDVTVSSRPSCSQPKVSVSSTVAS